MLIAFLFARVYAGQSVNESTCGSNFWICGQNPLVWPLKSPSAVLLQGTIYFIMLLKLLTYFCGRNFCDHSNETSLALLSHATICFSVFNKMNLGFVSLTFT